MKRLLNQIAYPCFDCEDCTGTGAGCYCAYNNASSPGIGPTRLQRLALWLIDAARAKSGSDQS